LKVELQMILIVKLVKNILI